MTDPTLHVIWWTFDWWYHVLAMFYYITVGVTALVFGAYNIYLFWQSENKRLVRALEAHEVLINRSFLEYHVSSPIAIKVLNENDRFKRREGEQLSKDKEEQYRKDLDRLTKGTVMILLHLVLYRSVWKTCRKLAKRYKKKHFKRDQRNSISDYECLQALIQARRTKHDDANKLNVLQHMALDYHQIAEGFLTATITADLKKCLLEILEGEELRDRAFAEHLRLVFKLKDPKP